MTSAAVATATATPSRACTVLHTQIPGTRLCREIPSEPSIGIIPLVPIPTETPNAGWRLPCSVLGDLRIGHVGARPYPCGGGFHRPKMAMCVERRAAPAPLHAVQWHTRARAVRGGPRGVHTAPHRGAVKKGWAADTHTTNSPSLLRVGGGGGPTPSIAERVRAE